MVSEKRWGSRGTCVSECVCLVSITVSRKLWLVLQWSATRQALMCYASRRNHLIIYCTDRVRAERSKDDTDRGRESEHRQAKQV